MTPETFQHTLREHFPTKLPDSSRLFEGVRVESGHEKLECLQSIEWPELSINVIEFISGEFWQLSNAWTQYYLPAVMSLSESTELKFNEFGDLPDRHEALMTCLFSYWCCIDNFRTEAFDITTNVFYGLKSSQIDILAHWLNAVNFEQLDKTFHLPENFAYTKDSLSNFLKKVRKFQA